ncbi:MAG: hypothetical protein JO218_16550 [Burkholderiales bacterium]|nr:hypothetical protein [Burkholderiales bacterium]
MSLLNMAPLLAALRKSRVLRVGLATVVGILWLNLILDWRDRVAADQASYRTAVHKYQRLQAEANQKEWPARAEQAEHALTQAEDRLWQGESLGLAQANFQDWLNRELVRLKAIRPTVKLAVAEVDTKNGEMPGDIRPLRGEISFDTNPAIMTPLLADMVVNKQAIQVESLNIKPGTARTEMIVSGYALVRALPTKGKP